MNKETLHKIQQQARDFAAAHLAVLAREVIAWHETGLVAQNAKLRELANLVRPLGAFDALALAENYTKRAALELAAVPSDD